MDEQTIQAIENLKMWQSHSTPNARVRRVPGGIIFTEIVMSRISEQHPIEINISSVFIPDQLPLQISGMAQETEG